MIIPVLTKRNLSVKKDQVFLLPISFFNAFYRVGLILISEPKLPGTLTLHEAPSSYEDAIKSCKANGAKLVEIQNEEEWVEVKSKCVHMSLCI